MSSGRSEAAHALLSQLMPETEFGRLLVALGCGAVVYYAYDISRWFALALMVAIVLGLIGIRDGWIVL